MITTISNIIPAPRTIGYSAVWAGSSVALHVAYKIFKPQYVWLAAGGIALSHVALYNFAAKKLKGTSSRFMENWHSLACNIASSMMFATTMGFLPAFYSVYSDLRNRNASLNTLENLMFGLGALGCGIPVTTALYKRGLEILHLREWSPLKDYLHAGPQLKGCVKLVLEKLSFLLGITFPDLLDSIPSIIVGRVKVLTLPFCSQEHQEMRIKELLEICKYYPPEQGALLWKYALSVFLKNPNNHKMLDEILQAAQDMPQSIRDRLPATTTEQLFPENVRNQIQQKRQELHSQHSAKITFLKASFDELRKEVEKENADYNAVIPKANKLRLETREYLAQLKVYCPDIDVTELTAIQTQLLLGPLAEKIQAISSRSLQGQVRFNADDSPADDFMLRYQMPGYQRLLSLMNIANAGSDAEAYRLLDLALERYEIATMGSLVAKVLGNDPALLNNQDEVFRRLEMYTQEHSASNIYRTLAGKAQSGAYSLVTLAGKAAYVSTMLFLTVIPIYLYPKQTRIGVAAGLFYYWAHSLQDILTLISGRTSRIRNIEHGIEIAVGRPILRLLTGRETLNLTSYNQADLCGKMRVLSYEMLKTWLTIDSSLAGYVSGAALAREIVLMKFPQAINRRSFT